MSNTMIPAPQTSLAAPATVTDAFLAVIERASRDPEVNLDKLQRLLDMRAQEYARIAAHQYREAMAACQTSMQVIRTDASNPQTKSRYATLAAVDAVARPIYTTHGFSLSFDTE